MKDVLLLNSDHTPIGVVDWRKTVLLLLEGRVDAVIDYPGLEIRSPSLSLPWPAVVALRKYAPVSRRGLALTRGAVLARDRFTCQYCGRASHPRETRGRSSVLTIDHVIPRAQARAGVVVLAGGKKIPVHSWENLVAACRPCNLAKGHLSLDRTGMKLAARPKTPGATDILRIRLAGLIIEPEWEPWLPTELARAA